MNIITQAFRTGALILTLLFSTSAFAQWQGTWDTNYGQIKLRQSANHVYGDYGSWGTIGGVVSKDRRTLRGVYRRNDDGSWGYIEWRLRGSSAFEGRWGKPNQVFPTVGETGIVWDGTRVSAQLPALSVYNGSGFIGDFMPAQPPIYTHWVRLFDLETGPVLPSGFNATQGLTPDKLRTAFEMLRIIRAVSQKGDRFRSNGEAQARQAFIDLGYSLLGDGIINATGRNVSLTRAAVAMKDDAVVLAFRGTKGDTIAETVTAGIGIDGDLRFVSPSFIPSSIRGGAAVHHGFHDAYLDLRVKIRAALKNQSGKHLFITGHSLGGAMAQLAAWDIAANRYGGFKSITIITSGAPRVGNAAFAQRFVSAVPDNLRIIVHQDPVPTVPWVEGQYVHAGPVLVIGRDDAVLIAHKDHDVQFSANPVKFARYHGNQHYFEAVRKLRNRAPNVSRLSPNGDRWAHDAALSWHQLSQETRAKPVERINNGLDKLRELLKR